VRSCKSARSEDTEHTEFGGDEDVVMDGGGFADGGLLRAIKKASGSASSRPSSRGSARSGGGAAAGDDDDDDLRVGNLRLPPWLLVQSARALASKAASGTGDEEAALSPGLISDMYAPLAYRHYQHVIFYEQHVAATRAAATELMGRLREHVKQDAESAGDEGGSFAVLPKAFVSDVAAFLAKHAIDAMEGSGLKLTQQQRQQLDAAGDLHGLRQQVANMGSSQGTTDSKLKELLRRRDGAAPVTTEEDHFKD